MLLSENQLRAVNEGMSSIESQSGPEIIAMATGTGKTIVGAEIISRQAQRGKKGLWVADRKALIGQTEKEISEYDPSLVLGIEQAEKRAGRLLQYDCVIGTSQSISQRTEDLERPDYIIIDECHTSGTAQYREIINWARVPVIGLTATPYGADGRILPLQVPRDWHRIRYEYGLAQAIEDRVLVPVSVKKVPIEGIKLHIDQPESTTEGIEATKAENLHKAAHAIINYGKGSTVIFCQSTKYSRMLTQVLNKIEGQENTRHLDCYSEEHKDGSAIEEFRAGKFQRISNCRLLTYGINVTRIETVVFACDRSLNGYLQGIGRGTRHCCKLSRATLGDKCECGTHKKRCIIIDLAENTDEWTGLYSEAIRKIRICEEMRVSEKDQQGPPEFNEEEAKTAEIASGMESVLISAPSTEMEPYKKAVTLANERIKAIGFNYEFADTLDPNKKEPLDEETINYLTEPTERLARAELRRVRITREEKNRIVNTIRNREKQGKVDAKTAAKLKELNQNRIPVESIAMMRAETAKRIIKRWT